MLSHLQDAETSQRGFLLTGEERYLVPYKAGADLVYVWIDQVKALTVDNPAQQASLEKVRKLAGAKLAGLAETIQLRKQAGFQPAVAVVHIDQGQRVMDEALRPCGPDADA